MKKESNKLKLKYLRISFTFICYLSRKKNYNILIPIVGEGQGTWLDIEPTTLNINEKMEQKNKKS